jgi:hypothetical protein
VLRAHARAPRDERHLVGHDERGVEPHAELADEVRVLGLVAGEPLEEFARARIWRWCRCSWITSSRDMPTPLSEMVMVRARFIEALPRS